jgi:tetratricopeptide (TPR) repeat protein
MLFHRTQTFHKNFARGQQRFEQGKYPLALMYLNAATRLKPFNRDVLTYLAVTYDKLGRKQNVLQQLEKLVQLDTRDIKNIQWLADLYYELGYFSKAEKTYHKVLARKKSRSAQKKLAEVLIWQKKYDQAIHILEQYPKNREYMKMLAEVYTWRQMYDKAIGLYTQLADSPEVDPEIILKLADALRFAQRHREAVVRYKQYLGIYGAL